MNEMKKYPVTMALMGICIIVYLYTTVRYGFTMSALEALEAGAYNPYYVFNLHQYTRLLTANILHFGIMHLVMNMYALYGLGCFMEMVLKRTQYILVILVSALTTTLLPGLVYLVNGFEMNVVSGGVSGVIFGIIGGIGALAMTRGSIFQDVFRDLSKNLILMLLISVLVPQISLSGHVGGLLGGFAVTWLITQRPQKRYS